jgi:hypothetical protein
MAANFFDQFDQTTPEPKKKNFFDQFDEGSTQDESRGVGGFLKDTAIDATKGVVGLGESAVGLANIATGNMAGKGLAKFGYDPSATKKILDSGYSTQRQEANQNVADAKGFIPTVKALAQNPSTAFGSIVESAPLSIGGVGVARGVATKMLSSALAKAGIAEGTAEAAAFSSKFFANPATMAAITAAGAGAEGATTTGLIQEQGRQEGRGWGKTVLPAIGAGLGTAAIGVLSSKVPGFHDAEAALAIAGRSGERTTILQAGKEIAKTMFKEGALEEMPQSYQEQVFTNLAMGKPWDEGAAESAGQGLIVGAFQGGGMESGSQTMNRLNQQEANPEISALPQDPAVRDIEQAFKPTSKPTGVISNALSKANSITETATRQDPWKNYDEEASRAVEDMAFAAGRKKSFEEMQNNNQAQGGQSEINKSAVENVATDIPSQIPGGEVDPRGMAGSVTPNAGRIMQVGREGDVSSQASESVRTAQPVPIVQPDGNINHPLGSYTTKQWNSLPTATQTSILEEMGRYDIQVAKEKQRDSDPLYNKNVHELFRKSDEDIASDMDKWPSPEEAAKSPYATSFSVSLSAMLGGGGRFSSISDIPVSGGKYASLHEYQNALEMELKKENKAKSSQDVETDGKLIEDRRKASLIDPARSSAGTIYAPTKDFQQTEDRQAVTDELMNDFADTSETVQAQDIAKTGKRSALLERITRNKAAKQEAAAQYEEYTPEVPKMTLREKLQAKREEKLNKALPTPISEDDAQLGNAGKMASPGAESFTQQSTADTVAPASSDKSATPKIDDTGKKLGSFIDRIAKRLAFESQGQGALDDMDEQGISPQAATKEFWEKTYFNLPEGVQQLFIGQLKASTGMEPGSVTSYNSTTGEKTIAESWLDVADILDMPSNVDDLQGTERGFVALMYEANQRFSGSKKQQATKTPLKLATESEQKPISEMTAADHMRAAAEKMDAMSKTTSKPSESAGQLGIQVNETSVPLTNGDAKEKQVHDFSNTQINVTGPAATKLIEFGKSIPDKELYIDPKDDSYGRETEPHITVRYGLAIDDPALLKDLSSLPPIDAKFGEVSIFENDKYDVVKVEIKSKSLRSANKKVGDLVDVPGETFTDYQPHATIAYVKKGEGKKYVGDKSLEGMAFQSYSINLVDRNNVTHSIKLKAVVEESLTTEAISEKEIPEKVAEKIEPLPPGRLSQETLTITKKGRKWFEATREGKSYPVKVEINKTSDGWAVGEIHSTPANVDIQSNKYGSTTTIYPLTGEQTAKSRDLSSVPELKKWLEYVEEKAPEYIYQNGVDKLKTLGIEKHPELKSRMDAAIQAVKNRKEVESAAKQEEVAEEAKRDKTYLSVPYDDRIKAKRAGAKFDGDRKKWYVTGDIPESLRQYGAEGPSGAGVLPGEQFRISGGEGYGYREMRAGQTIRNPRDTGPRYVTILSASKRYYSDDGMSFGVGDDRGHVFSAIARESTDEESATLRDTEQARDEVKRAKAALSVIADKIKKDGEHPEGSNTPDGERYADTQNIYGGGEWFVIGDKDIWYVKNNGMDGDNWGGNNVSTGGAGGIGWRIPFESKTAEDIKKSASIAYPNKSFYSIDSPTITDTISKKTHEDVAGITNAYQLLTAAISNGNAATSALAKLLRKTISDEKLLNTPVSFAKVAHSSYHVSNGITIALKDADALAYNTMLHEAVHAVTVKEMKASPILRLQVKQMMKQVGRKVDAKLLTLAKESEGQSKKFLDKAQGKGFTDEEMATAYALSSPEEFLAQAFSSKSFQELLKSIPATSTDSTIKTLWDRLVALVGKALGITDRNMLSDVISTVVHIGQHEVSVDYNGAANLSAEKSKGSLIDKSDLFLEKQKQVERKEVIRKAQFIFRRRMTDRIAGLSRTGSGASLAETWINWSQDDMADSEADKLDLTHSELEDRYLADIKEVLKGENIDASSFVDYMGSLSGDLKHFLELSSKSGTELAFQAKKMANQMNQSLEEDHNLSATPDRIPQTETAENGFDHMNQGNSVASTWNSDDNIAQNTEDDISLSAVSEKVETIRRDIVDRITASSQRWKERFENFVYNWLNTNDPRKRIYAKADKKTVKNDMVTVEELRGKKTADEVQRTRETVVEPMLKELAQAKLTVSDLEEYGHGLHASERNQRMREVNAKRKLDEFLKHMTDTEAEKWKQAMSDLRSKTVMEDDLDSKDTQQGYLELIDEVIADIDSREARIAERQKELDAREFTEEEIAKGTPERKQGEIDNALDRIEATQKLTDKWSEESPRLSGMTDEEGQAIIDKWQKDPRFKSMQSAKKKLDLINRMGVEALHDSGELTDDEYNGIVTGYKHYVPLQREGFLDTTPTVGRITGPTGKPLKVAMGSMREVVNIVAHSVQNYETAVNRKHKAAAGKALYQFVLDNPDSGMTIEKVAKQPTHDKEGNVVMYPTMQEPPNGVFIKVQVEKTVRGEKKMVSEKKLIVFDTDQRTPQGRTVARFLDSIKGQDAQLGPLMAKLSQVNRYLAMINTMLSPEFVLSNFVRDFQTAFIHLSDEKIRENKGLRTKIAKDIFPAIKGIFKAESGNDSTDMGKWYRDFSKNGGKIGWMQGYEKIEDLAKELEYTMKLYGEGHTALKKLDALKKLVSRSNTAVENGVRLATYKNLVESGVSKSEAASVASKLTVDFTQKGKQGPALNALFMFANAGIQGNLRMIQAIGKSREVRKIVGGVVAGGFALQLLALASGGDDDSGEPYILGIADFIRERNMIFMIPGTKGKYISIPMPYGYNGFNNIGAEAANMLYMAMTGRKYNTAGGAMRVVTTFANAFNPLASGTILQTLSPTIADPIVMAAENKNFMGNDLMPNQNPFGPEKPDSERYWKNVSPTSKIVTSMVNRMTGGDRFKGGLVDMSPETLDMLYDTVTGSTGKFVSNVLHIPVRAATGELEVNNVPFARRFTGSWNERAISNRYYEAVKEWDVAKQRYDGAETPFERARVSASPEFKLYRRSKLAEKQLTNLLKSLKLAEARKDKERTETIKNRITSVQMNFLNRMEN